MNGSRLNLGAGLNLALFVVITGIVWFLLGRMGGGVRWMTAAAPRSATIGESLPLRIHVNWLQEPTRLCADLHWSTNRDSSNLFLASGGSTSVGPEGGSFDFEIMVPPRPGLRYVHGIIYLSPTGEWEDHTLVVATDLIPVTTNHTDGATELTLLPVNRPEESPRPSSPRLSPVLRRVSALCLLIASVLGLRNLRFKSGTARRGWLVLAASLCLAALWEFLGLESAVADLLRSWLRAEDLYYSRARFQQLTISSVLAVAILSLRVAWLKPWPHRWPLMLFGLYLALAVVSLLSFHSLDRYADISWRGFRLMDGLKLLSVAAVLIGVIVAGKRAQAPPPITTE